MTYFKKMSFRIRDGSMPKKRRMPILYGQIMLILLALLTFFVYFGVRRVSPIEANPYMIIGFGLLATGILLETVAYEKTSVKNADIPYLPPPPSNICPTCHHPLTFIEQYKAWYCFNCKEYR
jgi:hypothetical protein